jgi:hypothetical protein
LFGNCFAGCFGGRGDFVGGAGGVDLLFFDALGRGLDLLHFGLGGLEVAFLQEGGDAHADFGDGFLTHVCISSWIRERARARWRLV